MLGFIGITAHTQYYFHFERNREAKFTIIEEYILVLYKNVGQRHLYLNNQ